MEHSYESQIRSCFSLFEDLPSRVIYSGQVYYNITGEYSYIARMLRTLFLEHRSCITSDKLAESFAQGIRELEALRPIRNFKVDHDNMYFDRQLITLQNHEVLIDCGAFDMSTSMEFAYATHDSYLKIVAFEPDPVAYEIAEDNLIFFSKEKRSQIYLFSSGVSDHNGMMPFERSSVLGNSRITDKSEENIEIQKIDDVPECQDATFLKVHVEGHELHALLGARNLITRMHPVIAVSCYHNLEELMEIPILIRQLWPDYKLYMRHYSTGTSESVLYAIPADRLPQGKGD
jgi:FkbM family methyltransferase